MPSDGPPAMGLPLPTALTAPSQSADFSLKCPDEWIDEQTAGLTCVVRKANLNEQCHEVSLRNYKAGQGSIKYCGAMHLTARSGCSARTQCVGPCTCSCREGAAHYTLTFYLQVDDKKQSGDWDCYWTHSDNPACSKGFQEETASCKGVSITPMIYGERGTERERERGREEGERGGRERGREEGERGGRERGREEGERGGRERGREEGERGGRERGGGKREREREGGEREGARWRERGRERERGEGEREGGGREREREGGREGERGGGREGGGRERGRERKRERERKTSELRTQNFITQGLRF